MAEIATPVRTHSATDMGPDYVCSAPPAFGVPSEVAEGIHWLRMPLPFALDHINLWMLEDQPGWTLVDTGLCIDEVKAHWDRVFADRIGGDPVRRVIATHFHPDHFGLAGWLCERGGAPLWMTRNEWLTAAFLYHDSEGRAAAAQADLFLRNGLDRERGAAIAARGNRYRRIISSPPPFRRLRDAERFSAGAHEWEVVVGTGHAPEHACLYCATPGVLIAGDQVLPKISPNVALWATEPEGNPLADFLRSLDRLRALPRDTLVLPSHGLPFRGLHARIDALVAHHAERLDLLRGFCAQPRSAADALPVLFKRELDLHQLLFAMGESLAHLAYLAADGSVRRRRDDDGVTRYTARC